MTRQHVIRRPHHPHRLARQHRPPQRRHWSWRTRTPIQGSPAGRPRMGSHTPRHRLHPVGAAVRDGSVIPYSPTRLGVRNSGFARVCVRHRQSGVRVRTHRVGMRQSCRSIRPSNRMGNQRADGNGMRMPAGGLFIRIPACQPIEACHPVDGDAGVHDALSVSYRAGARFPRRDR